MKQNKSIISRQVKTTNGTYNDKDDNNYNIPNHTHTQKNDKNRRLLIFLGKRSYLDNMIACSQTVEKHGKIE